MTAILTVLLIGQLATPENETNYRKLFPKVDNQAVTALLADPGLLFYSGLEMPRAYQFRGGVHSAFFNISAGASEARKGNGGGGNGNIEFPWNTGGLDRTTNGGSFFFLKLPASNQGGVMPIVWWRDDRFHWRFPTGTIFGEVLWLKGPSGMGACFELRTRTKDSRGWESDLFRPFPTQQELIAALAERKQTQLASAIAAAQTVQMLSLVDAHPRVSFRQTALSQTLPAMSEQLVFDLLRSTPFKTCKGKAWIESTSGEKGFAPTATGLSLVATNFEGPFLSVTRQDCRRCHQQVDQQVRLFEQNRDWYGRIRGSDETLSFHPFSPESISPNGFNRTVTMRRELVEAGLLAQFDPQRHDERFYQPSEN